MLHPWACACARALGTDEVCGVVALAAHLLSVLSLEIKGTRLRGSVASPGQARVQGAGRGRDVRRDGAGGQPAAGARRRVGAAQAPPLRGPVWRPGAARPGRPLTQAARSHVPMCCQAPWAGPVHALTLAAASQRSCDILWACSHTASSATLRGPVRRPGAARPGRPLT